MGDWPINRHLVGSVRIGAMSNRLLECDVFEEWITIISRRLTCGATYSRRLMHKRGVAEEEAEKLDSLLEGQIGIPSLGHLRSQIQSAISKSISWEVITEQSEDFVFEVGKCDHRLIALSQMLRIYEFSYSEKGFFRDYHHAFEIQEYVDHIWDKGTIFRNHPGCGCSMEPKDHDGLFGVKACEKIYSTEQYEVSGDSVNFVRLGLSLPKMPHEGDVYVLPSQSLPRYLYFLAGVNPGREVNASFVFHISGHRERADLLSWPSKSVAVFEDFTSPVQSWRSETASGGGESSRRST